MSVAEDRRTMQDTAMQINSVRIGQRCRRELGDLAGLAASINDIGLLHPVVVTPDGELIAGQRRLEACRLLGWARVPVNVVDIKDIVRGEHDENAVRKDFLPSEMVAIGRALEPTEREAAKERIREGAKAGPAIRDSLPIPVENYHRDNVDKHTKTRDKLASFVGISGRTLEKARQVVEAAEREPEKYGDLLFLLVASGSIESSS